MIADDAFRPDGKGGQAMLNTGPFRRLSLCFLVILLGLWLLPIPARAEEQITLSSFEELRDACFDTSGGAASFLCTADDFIITEDIEIPEGFVITFRNFTVPEGITLTVTECRDQNVLFHRAGDAQQFWEGCSEGSLGDLGGRRYEKFRSYSGAC